MITKRRFTDVSLPKDIQIIEIETTGLTPHKHRVAVCSLLHYDDAWVIDQWLADANEEHDLLRTVLPLLLHHNNGMFNTQFGKNFLEKRTDALDLHFPETAWIDVSKTLKAVQPWVVYPSYAKVNLVEEILDQPLLLTGKEMAQYIKKYHKKPTDIIEGEILDQSARQVQWTAELWTHAQAQHENLCGNVAQGQFCLQELSLKHEFLHVSAHAHFSDFRFHETETIVFEQKDNALSLRIEAKEALISENTTCLFTDVDDTTLMDTTGFQVPEGLFLLQVDGAYLPHAFLEIFQWFLKQ